MVFVPKFQEPSDSLIIDNVLTIVQRDFKAALDYFYSAENLPDFVERTLGRFFKLDYPTFAIDPSRNGPEQSADGAYVEEVIRVNLYFAVSHADAPTTERLAMKYMRALKSILRSASAADYFAGFPVGTVFALTVELSYEYGLLGKNATAYEKPVSLELSLKFQTR